MNILKRKIHYQRLQDILVQKNLFKPTVKVVTFFLLAAGKMIGQQTAFVSRLL